MEGSVCKKEHYYCVQNVHVFLAFRGSSCFVSVLHFSSISTYVDFFLQISDASIMYGSYFAGSCRVGADGRVRRERLVRWHD